ncbi:hypothetical protein KIN20_030615 [Parelaphostrongylus tenuis]|uniref:Uncharacterized protein n=1 Tax=Parelaphostrongylus tenuis TaxID=148309 RepID=A0AAD5R3Z1_PARTN|nr:hypothetical protein KIN20_030615 [Parelaphostrongylus tenuis]
MSETVDLPFCVPPTDGLLLPRDHQHRCGAPIGEGWRSVLDSDRLRCAKRRGRVHAMFVASLGGETPPQDTLRRSTMNALPDTTARLSSRLHEDALD